MNTSILYYAVYMENTLGYLFSDSDGRNMLGILHASILKGSTFNWLSGPIQVNMNQVRKATEEDFNSYRVSIPPDFNN